MSEPLTPRQRQILRHIAVSIMRTGIVPSVREIGQALGMRSPSTVHQHLSALERKGYLRRDGERMRVLEITDRSMLPETGEVVSLPLVGRVSAGVPVLAEQHIEEMIPVPRRFVGWNDESFLLTVRGDSMIGAGIFDGDLVIVRCQPAADRGDLVVALIDDEATVKRLEFDEGGPYLKAENPAYVPIREEFEIIGKVVGLLRRYPLGGQA
ncbi:MAG: transcriptional repressor LexA [Armatimonadetes bacterium]|nr:transcriptional repressor LexA [Armatimonadota bacterium]